MPDWFEWIFWGVVLFSSIYWLLGKFPGSRQNRPGGQDVLDRTPVSPELPEDADKPVVVHDIDD